ncbi:MAG: hypothetical protein WD066_18750 [Planctomycetaceae bacterium]
MHRMTGPPHELTIRAFRDSMHLNPVRAGLVSRAIDWRWSSARWYLEGRPVGLPIPWTPGFE